MDPSSVRFGREGTEAAPFHHPALVDVDHDGDRDLLLFFRTRATGLQCGDTKAVLTGNTKDGKEIRGEDRIKTIGCPLRLRRSASKTRLRRVFFIQFSRFIKFFAASNLQPVHRTCPGKTR